MLKGSMQSLKNNTNVIVDNQTDIWLKEVYIYIYIYI